MKMSGAIAMSLACALAGYFGGRISSSPASAPDTSVSAQGSPSGDPASTDSPGRPLAPRKNGSRDTGDRAGKKRGSLADSLAEMLHSWNHQDVVMPGGAESELLLFDMAKFSRIMASLQKTTAADISELKDMLNSDEEDESEETEILKALVMLPVLARDIELRGARALDAEIERGLEDPIESDVEEILPTMAYTLAIQNPEEAEQWLESLSSRDDLDDLLIDEDELQAAIDKAKLKASGSK